LKGRGIGTGHLILLSTTAFILGVGLASQVKSYVWRPIVLPMATQAIKSYGQLTHPLTEPTALLIDIKHENYQKLAYQREMALLIGKLFQTDNSFVSADVSVGGVAFRARLRLKGDNTDHLRHEKWSFRVVLKGDGRIFGLKQFSLQHPESRNYLFELLYHAFLKTEDVLSLRYHFVNVKLNGKDLGIYALEEHFDKLLVEHRRRREGPILRFNESLMWQENLQWTRPFPEADISTYGSYLSSDVDVFKTASVLADSTQRTLFRTAATLLESFRAGRLRPNDVFDVQKMADYLAVSGPAGCRARNKVAQRPVLLQPDLRAPRADRFRRHGRAVAARNLCVPLRALRGCIRPTSKQDSLRQRRLSDFSSGRSCDVWGLHGIATEGECSGLPRYAAGQSV
jgi:hypothetical protein